MSATPTSSGVFPLDEDATIQRFQTLLRMKTVANEGPVNGKYIR